MPSTISNKDEATVSIRIEDGEEQALASTQETLRKPPPPAKITPLHKKKILKTTVRNARNLQNVYKRIDSDMSHLIKNFRANYMKHSRAKNSNGRSPLDLSLSDLAVDKAGTIGAISPANPFSSGKQQLD